MVTPNTPAPPAARVAPPSGIAIREANDGGARVQMGRIPTSSYNGYFWTSIAGGSGGGVPSFTGATRWVRIIRKGNTITASTRRMPADHTRDLAQLGQSQTVINAGASARGLQREQRQRRRPQHRDLLQSQHRAADKAPVITSGSAGHLPALARTLDGTVTDDNYPTPISLTTQWSQRSGPGSITFGNTSWWTPAPAFLSEVPTSPAFRRMTRAR